MQTQQDPELTPTEARQGVRVGLIWILTAGTLVAIMGMGAALLLQGI